MNENGTIVQDSIYSWMQGTFKEKGANSVAGKSALGSTRGRVRNENQDRAAVVMVSPNPSLSVPVQVAVLCDGIGGLRNGAEAATLAISSFISQLVHLTDGNIHGFLERAANFSNREVYSAYNGKGGCTLSAVSITASGVVDFVNYGDSRIYRYNAESLIQLTTDDTLDGQLAKMDRRAVNSFPEFKHLVQFIGMEDRVESSSASGFKFENHDRLLIASDGAYDVDSPTMQKILANSTSAEDGVKKLLLISEWLGGKDNATAISIPAFLQVGEIKNTRNPLVYVWTWNAEFSFSYGSINTYYENNSMQPKAAVNRSVTAKRTNLEKHKKKKNTTINQSKIGSNIFQRDNDIGNSPKEETPQLRIEFDKEGEE
jgi:serine/threonine protein phosphatase PrpC